MGRWWRLLLGGWLLISVACGPGAAPQLREVHLEGEGLSLSLVDGMEEGEIRVTNTQGMVVAGRPPGPVPPELRLLFRWTPGETYTLTVDSPAGQIQQTLQAPERRDNLRVEWGVPWGQSSILLVKNEPRVYTAVATAGAHIQLGLQITQPGDGTQHLTCHWGLPPELKTADPTWTGETHHTLQGFGARDFVLVEVILPSEPGVWQLALTVFDDTTGEQWMATAVLSTLDLPTLRNRLTVGELRYPVDREGGAETQRLPDTLALAGPIWGGLGRLVGEHPTSLDPYSPVGNQALTLTNHLDHPLQVVALSEVVDPLTLERAPGFQPRVFEVTGGTGIITSLCYVPAGQSTSCLLPVYALPEVAPGQYLRRVRVQLLGQDEPLAEVSAPLTVLRENSRALGTLAVVLPLTLLWIGLGAWYHKRWLATWSLEELALISLFSALLFGVGLMTELSMTLAAALLGPLNVLVGGLLAEGLTHLLLTSLLCLLPRVGVITLVGVVQTLLRGAMTGQLSPVDPLFLTPVLLSRELTLWAFGITRGKRLDDTFSTVTRTALAFGVAGMVSAWTSLALHSAFYRLFFADWFVVLNLGVGLVYPLPGVIWGLKWGQELRKIRP